MPKLFYGPSRFALGTRNKHMTGACEFSWRMTILLSERAYGDLYLAIPVSRCAAKPRDGAQAIEEAERLKPDVVVLNITMPVLDGIAAAREITAKLPESAIVILSSHADKRFIAEARKSGARAYVGEDQTRRGAHPGHRSGRDRRRLCPGGATGAQSTDLQTISTLSDRPFA